MKNLEENYLLQFIGSGTTPICVQSNTADLAGQSVPFVSFPISEEHTASPAVVDD